MTAEEKEKMMQEIMQVVEKHVSNSENKAPISENKYGKEYGISDREMRKWKEEYRRMRVEGKQILEEVRKHPINTLGLESSFDLGLHTALLKE